MVKVSSQNYKILYHLWSLSKLGSTVSVQLCLDFSKNSALSKIGWKTKLLRFRISSNGFQLNLKIFQNPWDLISRSISSSRGDKWNPEAEARKTQIFKVLRFEPNFRGRFFVTSKGTPWPNLTKKPLTKWIIHVSSEVYTFSQVLGWANTSSSKFSPMAPQF